MTREQEIIRAKVGLLELAKQLGNVSQAGKMDGLLARQLLPLQGASATPGGELARQELTRRKPLLANRTAPEMEAAISAGWSSPPSARSGSPTRCATGALPLAGGRARGVAAP